MVRRRPSRDILIALVEPYLAQYFFRHNHKEGMGNDWRGCGGSSSRCRGLCGFDRRKKRSLSFHIFSVITTWYSICLRSSSVNVPFRILRRSCSRFVRYGSSSLGILKEMADEGKLDCYLVECLAAAVREKQNEGKENSSNFRRILLSDATATISPD